MEERKKNYAQLARRPQGDDPRRDKASRLISTLNPTTTPPPSSNNKTPHKTRRSRQTHTHAQTGNSKRDLCSLLLRARLFSAIMGVQSSDGQVMFSSSIALLQQRFRELERIREKREERLLHVLAPRPAAAALLRETTTPVKWFFHPELLYPCRPLRDTAVAAAALFPAAPTTACECKSFQLRRDPITVELWPSKTYNYKHVSGEVDVDTSLHL